MDVRKNTLHFKLWKLSVWIRDTFDMDYDREEEPPNNICPYFWQIVIWAFAMPLFVSFLAICASFSALLVPPILWMGKNCVMSDYIFYGLIPYWFTILIGYTVGSFIYKNDKARSYLGESAAVGYEYVKARSSNLCIKLNWIDDEVEDEDTELPDVELPDEEPKEKTLGEEIEDAINANIERMSDEESE